MKTENSMIDFDCKPVDQLYFNCNSKQKSPVSGQIILTAKRLGSQAKPAVYELPLKLKH